MLGHRTPQRGGNGKKEEEGNRDDKEIENLTNLPFCLVLGLLSAQCLSSEGLWILQGIGSIRVKQDDLTQNILEQCCQG